MSMSCPDGAIPMVYEEGGVKVRNLQKENIPDINRIRKKILCSDFLPDFYNRIMVR
jgi:hypothetical protein